MNMGREQQEERNKYEKLHEANQKSSFIKEIIPDHSTSGNAVISCRNYNKSKPTIEKLYSNIKWIGYSSNNVPPGFISYFGTTLKVNIDGTYTIYTSTTTFNKGKLYINGKEIGNMDRERTYYQVNEFKVKLNKGYYGITVSIKKGQGNQLSSCGFNSSFALFVKDPSGNVILHTDTNWKASSYPINYKNLSEIKEILKKVELRKISNRKITKENAIISQKRSMEKKINTTFLDDNVVSDEHIMFRNNLHSSNTCVNLNQFALGCNKSKNTNLSSVIHKKANSNISESSLSKEANIESPNLNNNKNSNIPESEHREITKIEENNINENKGKSNIKVSHNIINDMKKYWWVVLLVAGHVL